MARLQYTFQTLFTQSLPDAAVNRAFSQQHEKWETGLVAVSSETLESHLSPEYLFEYFIHTVCT